MGTTTKVITVTSAKFSDLDKIHRLEQRCFQFDKLSLLKYKKYIQGPAKLLVAKYKNNIIGSALILIRKNAVSCRLYSIAIDPKFRGIGAGKKLFRSVERYVKRNKYKRLNLEVNKNNVEAIQFYKSHGFVIFASYKHYYENGEDAHRMRKNYP